MAIESLHTNLTGEYALPEVRRIHLADLRIALARGFDDFKAMPSHVVFIGLIYAVAGLVLGKLASGYDLLPIIFPLIGGFALVGPVAALGLYELSRRREKGLPTGWGEALSVRRSPSLGGIVTLGILLLVIFGAWLDVAEALYVRGFGPVDPNMTVDGFAYQVLNTHEGLVMIVAGNFIGFLFAALVLTISVVSFPMLLDRRVGATTAIVTSIRAVMRNPIPMAAWGLIVAVLLALGSLPALVGLAVVMPVLGHATWHLYRLMVAD